jgi:hypothetical protein
MNTEPKKAREIALEAAVRLATANYSQRGNALTNALSTVSILSDAKKIETYLMENEPKIDIQAKIEEMIRIIDYCFDHDLPREHHFFGNLEEIERLTAWTKELGSSGLQRSETTIYFLFGGFKFFFHDTGKKNSPIKKTANVS